jgi:hypothetical protein
MRAVLELRKNGWHTTLEPGRCGLSEIPKWALRSADEVVLDGDRYDVRQDRCGGDVYLRRRDR